MQSSAQRTEKMDTISDIRISLSLSLSLSLSREFSKEERSPILQAESRAAAGQSFTRCRGELDGGVEGGTDESRDYFPVGNSSSFGGRRKKEETSLRRKKKGRGKSKTSRMEGRALAVAIPIEDTRAHRAPGATLSVRSRRFRAESRK